MDSLKESRIFDPSKDDVAPGAQKAADCSGGVIVINRKAPPLLVTLMTARRFLFAPAYFAAAILGLPHRLIVGWRNSKQSFHSPSAISLLDGRIGFVESPVSLTLGSVYVGPVLIAPFFGVIGMATLAGLSFPSLGEVGNRLNGATLVTHHHRATIPRRLRGASIGFAQWTFT